MTAAKKSQPVRWHRDFAGRKNGVGNLYYAKRGKAYAIVKKIRGGQKDGTYAVRIHNAATDEAIVDAVHTGRVRCCLSQAAELLQQAQ